MYFNNFYARNYYTDTYWGLSGTPVEVVDPGGYVGFIGNLREEEELMIIIQSFLHMRS